MNRIIYHGKDNWNSLDDKVLIREGGDPAPLDQDACNDANECYIGFKKTYDFLLKFFDRDSLDGRGLLLRGVVHYGKDFANAQWDGQRLLFGTGGDLYNGFTDELDVIAHEMGHGIIHHTAKLRYHNQSGALNESIADVFGIMVKQWGEKESPQTAEESNWLLGEGLVQEAGIKALRDMKNPGSTSTGHPQPAHWKDFAHLEDTEDGDFGGVHRNSGIPNRAFALAATKIGGYSWEGAGQIWYKALTQPGLHEDASFKEFADATIANAGQHATSVKKAWEGVGYPFPPHRNEL